MSLRAVEGEDTSPCRSNRITTTQARQIKTLRFGSDGILTATVQMLPQDLGVDSEFGTKDLLALIYDAGRAGRFRSADVVGAGSDHPDFHSLLVGSIPQQLVRLVLGAYYE